MKVSIKETLERVVEVESIEEAKCLYKSSEIVLDSSDFIDVEFTEME